MSPLLRKKILATCEAKIAAKGPAVGLSFYAFFANKNDDPELLMERLPCSLVPTFVLPRLIRTHLCAKRQNASESPSVFSLSDQVANFLRGL